MSIRIVVISLIFGVILSACQTVPEQADFTAHDYYLSGMAAFEEGDYQIALTDLEEAVRRDPGYADAFCLMGKVNEKLDRIQPAITAYRDCLRIQPGNGDGHARIGILYAQIMQYGPAEAHLKKAVEYAPANVLAHFYLAEIYRKQGKCSSPLRLYKQALLLDPDFVDAIEGKRLVRNQNCKKPKSVPVRKSPPVRRESEFTGGGKALRPSEW